MILPGFHECAECGGTGDEYEDSMSAYGIPGGYVIVGMCPECGGAGQVPDDDTVNRRAVEMAMELGHTLASVDPPIAGPNTFSMARDDLLAYARHTQETKP